MDIGINFRATSGYVTDAAGETYSLGEAYPTTRGGVTFGWSVNLTSQTRDRFTTGDRRLAGLAFTNSLSDYFRIDLPAAGLYDVHLAMGDHGNMQQCRWDLKDTTSILKSYGTVTHDVPAANYCDASDVIRSEANWPSQEIKTTQTFATTQLRLQCATTTFYDVVNHIRVVSAGNRRRRVLLCGRAA